MFFLLNNIISIEFRMINPGSNVVSLKTINEHNWLVLIWKF